MIRQGVEWTADGREDCDVLVIGSGCGGATLANALAERGRDVIILEQGGYYTKEDFDQREVNMLAKIDGGRGLDTSDDAAVSLTYGNNVGGASVHYWADSYRLPADRHTEWEERFGLQGHGPSVLAAHFDRLERDLNVHPAEDPYANRMNVLFRDAARALGWRVDRVPQARKGCVQSGFCMQGCSYDAKQSQLVTHLPAALAHGARLFSDLLAARLFFRGPRVESVLGQVLDRATGTPTGRVVEILPKAVVLAAGGYGTPKILLRHGLKDGLPSVGEHIFCNPCPMSHARFDEDIIQWRNIPAAWGVDEFRLARFDASGAYREGGYLLMPNQLQPATLAAVLPLFGADLRAFLRDLPRLGGAIAWIDDDERGRMTLESGGQTRLTVHLGPGNRARIRDAWKKQARLLFTAGATEVLFGDVACTTVRSVGEVDAAVEGIDVRPGRNVLAAPHPGGGARMGASVDDSVVGFDHRVHGTDNLYVADPSVFPSPPSVDPSLTIMAFSYVAADAVDAALG